MRYLYRLYPWLFQREITMRCRLSRRRHWEAEARRVIF